MQYLVTGREMKHLDTNTSEHFGVPSVVLMEQAAQAFVEKLLVLHPEPGNVLVVCGSGNNGGDGIAIARLLNQRKISATLYVPSDKKSSELFRLQQKIYLSYQYPLVTELAEDVQYEIIVDAIFGTGLSRTIGSPYDRVIDRLNQMDAHRVAVDIASGISSESGEIFGVAFHADDTITFSFGKIGSYLWPGAGYSGNIHVVPIGITEESFLDRKPHYAALGWSDLALLPKRMPNSHKGTYGKLLVIAGSHNMAGAAVFAAKAAYRIGCGLVKVMTAEENASIVLNALPEAILSTYGKNIDPRQLVEDLKWADAVVLGPGLGTSAAARELLHQVLKNSSVPLVLDADALNLLAEETDLLLRPHTEIVVTPHLGEMARLTGDAVSYIKTKMTAAAQDFAHKYDVICVLKDAHTVVAVPYGLCYLNLSGNNGMATAGSGDVLSGVIGGLLAQGVTAQTAAPLGVYLHGIAGDEAKKHLGTYSMMASDIVDGISTVLMQVK